MGVYDLYSKRQSRERGEMPDVYTYDKLPDPLRVQIVHIIQDVIPNHYVYEREVANVYDFINNTLCREYGLFSLINAERLDSQTSVINFFLKVTLTERALDVVELLFKIISNTDWIPDSEEAIAELNERFKEHGVGFQFESNQLIRMDSNFLHSEAVKPTLMVLRGDEFKGANEEFLMAHDHYRHGRYKDCLVHASKAFESTMKVICTIRGWTIQPNDTAAKLIRVCIDKGLFPPYLDSQMGSLQSLLSSGVPTIRNKLGGHGQGTDLIFVEEYFARYALNLTATSILFLVDANLTKV